MKAVALFLILAASPLIGQTAKVIALSPEDAAEAKTLYTQKAEIEKRIINLTDTIQHKYLALVPPHEGLNGFRHFKDGWSIGFEFSEDYKFIVPKVWTPLPSSPCCSASWGCFNPNPATITGTAPTPSSNGNLVMTY